MSARRAPPAREGELPLLLCSVNAAERPECYQRVCDKGAEADAALADALDKITLYKEDSLYVDEEDIGAQVIEYEDDANDSDKDVYVVDGKLKVKRKREVVWKELVEENLEHNLKLSRQLATYRNNLYQNVFGNVLDYSWNKWYPATNPGDYTGWDVYMPPKADSSKGTFIYGQLPHFLREDWRPKPQGQESTDSTFTFSEAVRPLIGRLIDFYNGTPLLLPYEKQVFVSTIVDVLSPERYETIHTEYTEEERDQWFETVLYHLVAGFPVQNKPFNIGMTKTPLPLPPGFLTFQRQLKIPNRPTPKDKVGKSVQFKGTEALYVGPRYKEWKQFMNGGQYGATDYEKKFRVMSCKERVFAWMQFLGYSKVATSSLEKHNRTAMREVVLRRAQAHAQAPAQDPAQAPAQGMDALLEEFL